MVTVLFAATLPWTAALPLDEPAAAAADRAGGEPATSRPQAPKPVLHLRPIFVCRDASPVIFSDRPCGQFAETRELLIREPAPGAVATIVHPAATAATKPLAQPRPSDAKTDDQAARCRRLLEERERLDDRMREGYPARQAARLWNRWRELREEIYAGRC